MDAREYLERYGVFGEEADFLAAKRLYERMLAGGEDAESLNGYGFLLECHARNELAQAVALYERAIERDPDLDKPHYQLISALAGLREPERAVRVYEERLAASPGQVREHRFLTQAYLVARAHAKALETATAGLGLAPGDAILIALRGEAKAGLGDVEGALGDWKLALELEPEDIAALYSTAFLLEREGRLAESAHAWQAIIDWSEARGNTLDVVWPKQELERLRRVEAS